MLSRAKTEINELVLTEIINYHYYFGQLSMNSTSLNDFNQCNSFINSYFQTDKKI